MVIFLLIIIVAVLLFGAAWVKATALKLVMVLAAFVAFIWLIADALPWIGENPAAALFFAAVILFGLGGIAKLTDPRRKKGKSNG